MRTVKRSQHQLFSMWYWQRKGDLQKQRLDVCRRILRQHQRASNDARNNAKRPHSLQLRTPRRPIQLQRRHLPPNGESRLDQVRHQTTWMDTSRPLEPMRRLGRTQERADQPNHQIVGRAEHLGQRVGHGGIHVLEEGRRCWWDWEYRCEGGPYDFEEECQWALACCQAWLAWWEE